MTNDNVKHLRPRGPPAAVWERLADRIAEQMVANLNRRALEIVEKVEANCHALSDPGNAAA